MNFITRVGILLYVIIILLFCVLSILFGQQSVEFSRFVRIIDVFYHDYNLRMMVSYVSVFVMLINYVLYRRVFWGTQKEKVIAFDNPSGRVSVSLVALDDLLRRKVLAVPEVKDVKSVIKATRKGLIVKIRLVLRTETNIPAISSKLQEIVTNKIRDTIGLEEQITVSIFIGKIIPEKAVIKKLPQKNENEDNVDANIPFQGYRA